MVDNIAALQISGVRQEGVGESVPSDIGHRIRIGRRAQQAEAIELTMLRHPVEVDSWVGRSMIHDGRSSSGQCASGRSHGRSTLRRRISGVLK